MEIRKINIEKLKEQLEEQAIISGYGGHDAPSLGAEEVLLIIKKRINEVEKAAEHRNKRHALENFKDLYFEVG